MNLKIKQFTNYFDDERFMRTLLVATVMNNVKPDSFAIKHLKLSDQHEQYIVSEDPINNAWRNRELNFALQALIVHWFWNKIPIMHSGVDNGEYGILTLTI